MSSQPLPPLPLPPGLSVSYVSTSDLQYHVISAGNTSTSSSKQPLILLLHGFPELAFSWRKVMPLLAAAGYYVVAYDQRGYGRTTGWDTRPYSDVDLTTFRITHLVTDAVRLVKALGYHEVQCVIGHDFGAAVATHCALIRGDMFKSTVFMSHPFNGSPKLPYNIANSPPSTSSPEENIHEALAALWPPRKAYKWYYSTEPACQDMTEPISELHSFLRGYFYLKSADWEGNKPEPLKAWTATELAKMPHYYVMRLSSSMREDVAHDMTLEEASTVQQKSNRWLPDSDLAIYVEEFSRTTFQGGLNWYRVATTPAHMCELELFAGSKIEVPAMYIGGEKDWGTFQVPGAFEGLGEVCKDLRGKYIVPGAGHWVQQEQPEVVVRLVLEFLRGLEV